MALLFGLEILRVRRPSPNSC